MVILLVSVRHFQQISIRLFTHTLSNLLKELPVKKKNNNKVKALYKSLVMLSAGTQSDRR